ncbi:hypothetical protein GQ55_3G386000 [Panicum hallii var. hallii]|uniref:Uncharacterized protein n=1 Tax=Panicum hallii var. hallii TaxID=1504633 RepID=A0A2T7EGF1_9POAL|nr:hypothetical protein GQ55_3G386000 [Panicum hallii var. hallii]
MKCQEIARESEERRASSKSPIPESPPSQAKLRLPSCCCSLHQPAKQSKLPPPTCCRCCRAEPSKPRHRQESPAAAGASISASGLDLRVPSMADQEAAWPPWTSLLLRALSRRRTWVALFLAVYAALLCSSWSLLASVRAWYYDSASASSSSASASPPPPAWPAALYASVMYGAVFGLLSMGAALAVAAPAMLVTWITVLVLLAFAGRPRRSLVAEGRRATRDIAGLALRVLLREGNAVAALCAAASFAALLLGRRDDGGGS